MVRRGFTLVEVLVALALLGVCVLGITAAAVLAARGLAAAHAEAGAALALASVADSLVLVPTPASGKRVDGRYRLAWTVAPVHGGARIEITATYDDGRETRSVPLVVFHAPLPPRIGGRP
jgi:prepilin-type N-terminal cleavage/methylation domain-containing protein